MNSRDTSDDVDFGAARPDRRLNSRFPCITAGETSLTRARYATFIICQLVCCQVSSPNLVRQNLATRNSAAYITVNLGGSLNQTT